MITTTISHLSDILLVHFTEKNLKVSLKNFSAERFKHLFSFSIHSFLIVLSDKLIELTDTVIIGVFMNPVAVALYSVPQRLVQYLRMLLTKSSEVLFPHFSGLCAQNRHDDIRETWLSGYRISCAIAACISVVYVTYGDVFQVLWMGEQFRDMYKILVILSLGFLLNQPITGSFLIAVERHKTASKLSVLQALLNTALSLLFVKHWGLVGVAVASCVPSFIISSLVLPFMANRMIGVSAGRFFVKSILPSLASAALPLAALFAIKQTGFGADYFQFAAICAIGAVLFALPYLLIFDKSLLSFKKAR
jgi:O-antigen/teichoic acid export membrane protein